MDRGAEEYVKGPPADAPAPGLHTCYYNKFFLLKMPVEVNGRRAQVKLNSKGSSVLSYCPGRGRDVDLSLSLISQRVATVLKKRDVYHVDTFYYHDVPMFSVSFASEAKLRKFVSTGKRSVQQELQKALGRLLGWRYSYLQKPRFVKQAKTTVWADVKVQNDLFLITPSRPGQAPQQVDITQVTPACVNSLYNEWHKSSLFTFGDIDALFNVNDCRFKDKEEEEAGLKNLLNELCDITHWFWFGANLGVSHARLLQIRKECHDIQDCIQEVILEWKKQEMPKWSKVVQALIAMHYKHKAEVLAEKYGVSYCIEKVQDVHMAYKASLKQVSDFEHSSQVEWGKKKQENLSIMIDKDNSEISELRTKYEEQLAEMKVLNEELQRKEEQCDTFHELQEHLHKDKKVLKAKLDKITEQKDKEIIQLKEELVKRKQILSKYSDRIQSLQQQLDKKTDEYKQISTRVTQLENERDKQMNKLRIMQNEHEQQLKCEAARTLWETRRAEEVMHQLEEAKKEASSIAAKLYTVELEKEDHLKEISQLQLDLQQKEEEIEKLQRKNSQAATNSTSTLIEEYEEEYMQLFKLMDSASQIKLELIETERQKAQKFAEHDRMKYEMERLKSKQADLKQCTAEGEGLQYATKHQESRFEVHIRNEYGKPCTCDQNVLAVLTSVTNKSQTNAVQVTRVSDTADSYDAVYTPPWHGIHELCVLVNGDHIMGSPFNVLIDNPPDPQHCTVSGPGVGSVIARDNYNPVIFEVHLADSDNEPCISEQNVTATLRMVGSGKVLETEMNKLMPSLYHFSCIPLETGIMEFEVNVNNIPFKKCQFEVCINNLPDLTHCMIIPLHTELQAVKKSKTKKLSFDIQLADSYNEPCTFEQDVIVYMKMRNTVSLSHTSQTIPFNVISKSPSLYQVSFIPNKAGEMEVSIMVNGGHIKHSPWNVQVCNPPDPQYCRVSCSDYLLKKHEQKPVSAEIHLMDSYNEPCAFKEDIFIAMEIRKFCVYDMPPIPIENPDIIHMSPSLYLIQFIPKITGECMVDVKINGIPVLGSPFELVIGNPPCIEHCEILDLQEQLQKGVHYTFRIRLADSDNERCEIPQQVTATLTMIESQSPIPVTVTCETPSQYTVSFTPHRAGWMSGCVKVNDTEMPPIKVLVTNTPDPEHCTALGPGLESVEKHKSKPVSFLVRLADSDNEPCVLKEEVKVTLKVKSSGSRIPVNIKIVPDDPPVYDVSYTPVEAGEMEVSIMVNWTHIKHSPWSVHVHNPPDPQHCKVTCSELLHRQKTPVSAQIHLLDSYNEPCVYEENVCISVELTKCDTHARISIPVRNLDIISKSPSQYQVSFIPEKAGEWRIDAKINGMSILRSSFILMIDNPPCIEHCEILNLQEQLQKGKRYTLIVRLADSKNKRCEIPQCVTAILRPQTLVSVRVTCETPSQYTVSFVPHRAGWMSGCVKVNDITLQSIKVLVTNTPDPEHCTALGPGLQSMKKDKSNPVSFQVRLADSYNEPCVLQQKVKVTLKMKRSGSQIPVEIKVHQDPPVYDVSYTPVEAGEMEVSIMVNGAHIKHSPWNVHIHNLPDPQHCTLTFSQHLVRSKTKYISDELRLMDSYNEPCAFEQNVTVAMVKRGAQIKHPDIICKSPSLYQVSFIPDIAGEWIVHVNINSVLRTSFKLTLDNPPYLQHCGILNLQQHLETRKYYTFWIRLADSDNERCENPQRVTATLTMIKSQSPVPVKVTCETPSQYTVSFTPHRAGWMSGCVKVNGITLRSFEVLVTNTPDPEHCTALGPGLESVKKDKSKPVSFQVRLADSDDQPCAPWQNVRVKMRMKSSGLRKYVWAIKPHYPSLYDVSYTPREAGEVEVYIMVNGAHIKNSPWTVKVRNPPDPQHCWVPCTDLQHKRGEKPVSAQIHLMDSYDEACVFEEDMSIAVWIRRSGAHIRESMPVENLDITHKSASLYQVSFIPDVAGEWIVDVKLNDVPISGSPFTLVIDNPPCIEHCEIFDLQEQLRIGTHYAFRIRLADSEKKMCKIHQQVTATLTMIESQSPVPVRVTCETPSQYTVSFTPHRAGWMSGYLNINGSITRSIKVLVTNTPDPEHCTALGPGLESVEKNKSNPVFFQVRLADSDNKPCISQEKVKVTMRMRFTGTQIPVKISVRNDPSVYDISYTPVEAGEMEVSITVNETHIQHSPQTIHVHSSPDPQHCWVTCSELLHKKGEKPVSAQIYLMDSYNEPWAFEEDYIFICLELRKSGGHGRRFHIIQDKDIIRKSPSLYQVSFIPRAAGEWIVDVKFNFVLTLESAFKLVIDNPPCIEHCKIWGLQEQLQQGIHYTFRIRLADADNERCEIPQRVTATLTMIKSQSPVPVTVTCETPSKYKVSFTPHRAGWMTGCVKVNDTDMPPIKVLVTNTPDPEHCTALGPGLESVKKNKSNPVSFQVRLVDSDNEPCVSKQKVKVTLKMKRSGSQIPVEIKVHRDPPVYDVSYTPAVAGEMEVSIMVNRAHIKHSPWNVHVHNTPDPEHCTALGPGLESVKKNKSNPVFFQVRLADSDNEPCVSQQKVEVSLIMKSTGLQIPVNVHYNPPVCDVSYTPIEAGEVEVSIMVNGRNIKHSPRNVQIHSTPDPEHCTALGPGLEEVKKDKTNPVSFQVRLADSDNEPCVSRQKVKVTLTVKSTGRQIPVNVHYNPPVYDISYTPAEAGEMEVSIMVNGRDIKHSPWIVHVHNPERCRTS